MSKRLYIHVPLIKYSKVTAQLLSYCVDLSFDVKGFF